MTSTSQLELRTGLRRLTTPSRLAEGIDTRLAEAAHWAAAAGASVLEVVPPPIRRYLAESRPTLLPHCHCATTEGEPGTALADSGTRWVTHGDGDGTLG